MKKLAIIAALLLFGTSAHAQLHKPHVTGDWAADLKADVADQKAAVTTAVTGKPATPQPLVCDFHILTQLKPDNLVDIIKTCVNTQKQELVDSTQAALDSAKAFTPNADQDAINCLTPAVALFRAAQEIPAVPAQDAVPAVLNADGTVKTPAIPAVAAIPEREPGLILLFQKYREFVLAGALTSCQSWVNTPVNATIAAGAGAVTGAAGVAAILVPKP